MSTMSSVDVSISTSSSVWNLATAKEFTITLELLLLPHVDAPITFRNAHASLFDPKRRENDQCGLFYKDLSRGVVLPLGRVQVCTFGARGSSSLPLQKDVNEEQFTTFYPGRPHQILLTRRPERYGPASEPDEGRFQRKQEDVNRESELAEVQRDVIRYNLVRTAQFRVKRNDSSDLRLSWP